MGSIKDKVFYLKRGVHELIFEEDLYSLLCLKNHLVIKIGFDPTFDRLHLGHLVILKKLRDFQTLGYFIHLVIGDFTASIGDPSGKSFTRKALLYENVKANYVNYDTFFFKILDKNLTYIYFNSVWFNFMYLSDFIQLSSCTTVSRLLERSDFKDRYNENKPIGIHEFIYPILQSYDSVFLCADIEIGGIDQKFNLLLARDLQKKFFQKTQVLFMMSILPGLDSKNKMSKSLNNCIYLDEEYFDIFSKVMSIPDLLMKEYFVSLGFLSSDEYDIFCMEVENLMFVKFNLAYRVVAYLYNDFLAAEAHSRFVSRFSKKNIDDIKLDIILINEKTIFLSDLFLKLHFVKSTSEFKRFLKCDSIKVNNVNIHDRNYILSVGNTYIIQCGKLKILKVFLKKI